MTETMGDAEVTVLESFLTDRPEMETISMQVRRVERLLARLYATAAERDAERALRTAAEAARDAALARAMPEPVLMETVEQVATLLAGAYRITVPPWRPRQWLLGRRYPAGTWTLLTSMGALRVMDDHIVGSWVQRLPDLPTPTAGETP